MKLSKSLLIVLLIQITEVLGFSLILPLLPFFAQDFGASPLVVASILSSFSLFQFVSAPILGRLSDYWGRKPLLLASQVSTFLSFVILARASSLWMIFLSRAVDGLLGSNFVVAQAYISDVSSKKNRSKAFGISGMAFGIGFLIGPAMGGYLSKFGFSVPAWAAAGMSLLSILLTFMFLKETVKKREVESDFKLFDLAVFKKYLQDKKLRRLLLGLLAYLLTHVIWTSNLALYTDRKWGFDAQDIGWMLAYVGLVTIIFRGVLISKMIDRWGEEKLKLWAVMAIVLGLVGFLGNGSVLSLAIILSLFAFGSGVIRPLMMGSISRSVGKNEQGAIMGLVNSLGSLTQIVGPLIGGYFLTYYFAESMILVSLSSMLVGGSFILIKKFNGKIAV
jgi:MFS transporter, DHA1 family, tetracycline resistance protein